MVQKRRMVGDTHEAAQDSALLLRPSERCRRIERYCNVKKLAPVDLRLAVICRWAVTLPIPPIRYFDGR